MYMADAAPARSIYLHSCDEPPVLVEISEKAAKLCGGIAGELEDREDDVHRHFVNMNGDASDGGATKPVLELFKELSERLADDEKAKKAATKAVDKAKLARLATTEPNAQEDAEAKAAACEAEAAKKVEKAATRTANTLKVSTQRFAHPTCVPSVKFGLVRIAGILMMEQVLELALREASKLFQGSVEDVRAALGHELDLTEEESIAAMQEPLLTPPGTVLPRTESVAPPKLRSQQTISSKLGRSLYTPHMDVKMACLNTLSAGCLRTLKGVSRSGLEAARLVLGDPQSEWRKKGGIFSGPSLEHEIAILQGTAGNEEKITALNTIMYSTDCQVELPAFTKVVQPLLFAKEKDLREEALRLLKLMDELRIDPEDGNAHPFSWFVKKASSHERRRRSPIGTLSWTVAKQPTASIDTGAPSILTHTLDWKQFSTGLSELNKQAGSLESLEQAGSLEQASRVDHLKHEMITMMGTALSLAEHTSSLGLDAVEGILATINGPVKNIWISSASIKSQAQQLYFKIDVSKALPTHVEIAKALLSGSSTAPYAAMLLLAMPPDLTELWNPLKDTNGQFGTMDETIQYRAKHMSLRADAADMVLGAYSGMNSLGEARSDLVRQLIFKIDVSQALLAHVKIVKAHYDDTKTCKETRLYAAMILLAMPPDLTQLWNSYESTKGQFETIDGIIRDRADHTSLRADAAELVLDACYMTSKPRWATHHVPKCQVHEDLITRLVFKIDVSNAQSTHVETLKALCSRDNIRWEQTAYSYAAMLLLAIDPCLTELWYTYEDHTAGTFKAADDIIRERAEHTKLYIDSDSDSDFDSDRQAVSPWKYIVAMANAEPLQDLALKLCLKADLSKLSTSDLEDITKCLEKAGRPLGPALARLLANSHTTFERCDAIAKLLLDEVKLNSLAQSASHIMAWAAKTPQTQLAVRLIEKLKECDTDVLKGDAMAELSMLSNAGAPEVQSAARNLMTKIQESMAPEDLWEGLNDAVSDDDDDDDE